MGTGAGGVDVDGPVDVLGNLAGLGWMAGGSTAFLGGGRGLE